MLAEPRPDVLDDRYEVGTLIGRGGMGDVHRAVDHRLGREVAIKFLRPDLAAQPAVRLRFEDEARSAARLTHPNVVMVLDSGEYDEHPYLVMECLPGHSLFDELVRGPLPTERVRSVGQDMLAALAAAHELGIVHRDVKPANILLTDDGRAKLADFGIAKTTEGLDHTIVGQVLGTPAYLAPERLSGHPATPSADLYALGVVLYEALLGEQPFPGDTPIAVAHAVANTEAVSLAERRPDIDAGLRAAIDGAMVKDPTRRFQSAAEMAAALDGLGGPATTVMETESAAGDPTRLLTATPPSVPTSSADARSRESTERHPPRSARQWWGTRPRELRIMMIGVAALIVLLLALNAAGGDDPGATAPATSTQSTPTQPLPDPLADALERLDEAVKR